MTPTKRASYLSYYWNQTPRYWQLTLTRPLTVTAHTKSVSGWSLNNSRATNSHPVGQNRTSEADSRWSTPEILRLYGQTQLSRKHSIVRRIRCRNIGHYPRLYRELRKSLYTIGNVNTPHVFNTDTSTINTRYFPNSTLTHQEPVKSAYITIV